MNYKRVLLITIVLGLVAHLFIYFANKPSIKNSDSEGVNIIAFGDSLVYGVGSTEGNDMFSVISNDLGVPIINKGVSGDTTNDGLKRLDDDVINNNPRIVLILFGGNDYLQNVPPETTFNNLETMINKIQDAGAAVIILGVRGGIFHDKYESNYKSLSRKYNTGYISDVLEGLITNRSLMYDSVHPNDKGYRIVAHRIEPILKEILSSN